jgi:hypothetical protein
MPSAKLNYKRNGRRYKDLKEFNNELSIAVWSLAHEWSKLCGKRLDHAFLIYQNVVQCY